MIRYCLVHLLVLLIPLAAGLAPTIALQTARSDVNESEESSESPREACATLATARRAEPTVFLKPVLARHQVCLSGRPRPRLNAAERPQPPGHRWSNGLCAPLRM